MKKDAKIDIKLVITAASKKELPETWIRQRGYPIVSTQGLLSGVLSRTSKAYPETSILVLITGIGSENAARSARVLKDHLHPHAVINVGSCGFNGPTGAGIPGEIIFPATTQGPSGKKLRCLKYPPFPIPEDLHVKRTERLQSLGTPLFKRDRQFAEFVDMEGWFQHEILDMAGISFCAFKVVTDLCSPDSPDIYRKNLPLLKERIKSILSFLELSQRKKKISVVIPVYNRSWCIKRAVDSVLTQTFPAGEVIVVNDGSTDETHTLLASYGNKIRLIRTIENRGVAAARNLGINASEGDWIALLDSDDTWERDRLLNQVKYLDQNPFLEILQCDEAWIRNGKRLNKKKYHQKTEGWIWHQSLERCMISPSCVLARKDLLKEHGLFDTAMPACEDYDLWLKITRHHIIGFNPQKDVVKYGGHACQLSFKYQAMDRFRIYALIHALEKETDDTRMEILKQAIISRLVILSSGALKRNLKQDVVIYRKIQKELEKGIPKCAAYPFLLKK